VVVYRTDDGWVIGETGWEALFAPTETNIYIYNPFAKQFVQRTAQGFQFNFKNYEEYLLYCEVCETKDGWPCPSWAVACELLNND